MRQAAVCMVPPLLFIKLKELRIAHRLGHLVPEAQTQLAPEIEIKSLHIFINLSHKEEKVGTSSARSLASSSTKLHSYPTNLKFLGIRLGAQQFARAAARRSRLTAGAAKIMREQS